MDIEDQKLEIQMWDDQIASSMDDECPAAIVKRDNWQSLLDGAKKRIDKVNALFNKVQDRRESSKRVIGHVFDCQPTEIPESGGFTKDRALIEINNNINCREKLRMMTTRTPISMRKKMTTN